LTLGKLMGIPLRLDATFILVPLALFSAMPNHLYEAVWPAAAVATLGVFLSILLHEVGHAAAARWQQVGVAEIVVGGFFGYATLKHQTVFRKQQLRILFAGPLANLAIFVLLWSLLALSARSGTGVGLLAYQPGQAMGWLGEATRVLALVNLAMFVFNMVPAFPLDGGKILGLLLVRRLSPRRSMQVVSVLSILAGVLMVFLGLGLSLFLALIGILIVVTNVRRLKRRAGASSSA
jgi:Zn-dependent protease